MSYNDKLAKIAVHKSLLKEYKNSSNERIVYMNDGTEFQIQIFNPYTYSIGVSFNFNNNSQGNSNLLVLRPGERVWLDRYLDNESRLLFSTYKVGNSQAVKEAIKDNGNLCIKFFKEQEKHVWNNNIWVTDNPCTSIDISYIQPTYYNTSITCDNNANISQPSAASYTSITCDNNGNILQSSAASYTSTYASTLNVGTNSCVNNNIAKKSIETGRIEKGSHSNQKFNSVHKDFEYFPFKTEYIKILPTSQKQINTNDLKKTYCHECGRKINTKYKFCPYCGTTQ